MNNLTKLLVGSAAAVTLLATTTGAFAQAGDPELDAAWSWMSTNGLTTTTSVSSYNPTGTLTRDQGSRFFSEYATSNLCLTPDTSRSCSFSDIGSADPTLATFVTKSCQLGIFNGSNGVFMPQAPLTKAQFVTALIRAVDGMKDENTTPRWKNYHAEALSLGITRESDSWALDRAVTRYEAALMLYRARVDGCGATPTTTTTTDNAASGGDDIATILADLFGEDDSTTTTPTSPEEETTTVTETTTTTTCPAVTCGESDCGTIMNTCGNSADCGACPDTTTTTTPTTTTNTSNTGVVSCDATVGLNAASPAGSGQEIPGLATAVVAMYDITANGSDLLVDNMNIQRIGLGSDDALDYIAIYTLDGSRVSNAKTFNSDDEAYISLNPKVTVPAGSTETFVVVAQIGDSNVASNEEFALRLNEFNSTCTANIEAGEFEVAAVNAAMIEIDDDGSVQNVELGNMDEEVATFTIDNNDDSDVFITSITLRDDENNADDNLANFKLMNDGDVIATAAAANGRYVTFQLDSPFMIEDGDNEDFEVTADIVAGAGEDIAFYIDRSLDVAGFDDTYGYGLNVNVDNYNVQRLTITAGELTFVNHAIPTDQTRGDKDNVVLMEFHIDVQAGQDLTLEDIKFDIYSDTPTCLAGGVDVEDILENIELRDVTNGGTYTLSVSTGAGGSQCHIVVEDSSMGLNLVQSGGDHVFQLVADITNDTRFLIDSAATPAWSNYGHEFYAEIKPSNGAYVEIIENIDDEQVTDIVPSFLSSEAVELVASSLEINRLPVSNRNVVNGGQDLLLIDFEIETDDVSLVTFDELTIMAGGAGSANFTDKFISEVSLFRGVYPNGTLLDSEDLNGGTTVTFDNFGDVLVPASSTQPMYVTVDLVDDQSNVTTPASLISATFAATNAIDADDDDNDSVPYTIGGTSTVNTIAIIDGGTLNIVHDSNDNEVQKEENVLGGSTSDFVAAFDLDGLNEDLFIEDLTLLAGGNASDFVNAIDSVSLYASDKTTLIYTESVSSSTISFNNINYVVPEAGTDTIYVKVTANPIGYQEIGKQSGPFDFTMSVNSSDVQGVDSGDAPAAGSILTSGASTPFYVTPVSISAVSFINSSGSTTKDSVLTAGDNNVAIIRITADNHAANTDTAGGDLDLDILSIALNESLAVGNTTVASYEIERVGGSDSPIAGTVAGGVVTFNVSGSSNDFELDPGETADFVVEAKGVILGGTSSSGGDDYVQLEFDDLPSGQITFGADDTGLSGYGPITDVRIGVDDLDNAQITD